MVEYLIPIGIGAAAKYNPHLWAAEELRSIFVARQNELAQILQALHNTAPNTIPQHFLITGQRGMGKTTLLQRTALAIEDDAELSNVWMPLRFPEEQYTVSTTSEFWLNVLSALADALERRGLPTDEMDTQLLQINNLPSTQREEVTLNLITQWCQSAQKRLVLLIDSTDLLFANLAGGEAGSKANKNASATALWRLRKTLSHTPEFLWIGGSYQALEATNLYGDAFFDFFQCIELRSLSVIEMQNTLTALAATFGAGRGLKGEAAKAEMMRVLNAHPERLQAMRQLTGGNPRTTIMLYELFAAGGDDSVRSDLERLLDMLTPLYKARLEALADQPRKIMAHILEYWAPITANKLADISNLAVTSISAQLSRLEQEGFVEKVKMPKTKRQGYQASERFFNIWYLMRNAPRSLRLRLTWLVEFMRLWYSPTELHGLAMERMTNHRNGQLCSSGDLEYSRAMVFALPPNSATQRRLDGSVYLAAKRGGLESELFDLDGDDRVYKTQEEYLVEEEKWRKATEENPNNAAAWNNLGYFLHYYLSRYEEAEQAYRQAITLDPKYATPWNNLGNLLKDYLARYEEAEQAYRQAIALDPKYVNPWNNLGQLLGYNLTRYEEAEQAYRQAIMLNPKYANSWYGLGTLLQDYLARYEEAEQAYRQAIALAPKDANQWNGLGTLLQDYLARYEEAEQAYRQAITLNPKFTYPIINLARLLAQQGKKAEATDYFRKTLDLADSEDYHILLQAHCWLGNQDLAVQALNTLAKTASTGNKNAFFRLKEQARECHALGLSDFLTNLMNTSPYADFLQPFSLALKAANGDADALLGIIAEIRVMAEEVLQFIRATAK